MIIYSTNSLFTFFFGALFKIDRFNSVKMAGVLLSLGGVIMVGLTDKEESGHESLLGDLLALLAAASYSLYALLFKRWIGNEDRIHNGMFLGKQRFYWRL
jgi:solute carrier family 35 protein F5